MSGALPTMNQAYGVINPRVGSAYQRPLQASEFVWCTAHHEPSLLRMLQVINRRVGSAYEGGLQAS
ncbi:hypothetical protein [Moorena producens]|uniref:hypothetical protein n=1 Tax=Moorena producens TaxID=1155739 RepID=UPI0011EA71BC|nr:hypothetical protein [Moorena producens]